LNVTRVRNEIISLGSENEDIITGDRILRVGESIGSFFLLKQIGIYQSDSEVPEQLFNEGIRAGDIKYEDINNDGIINSDDRQLLGNQNPEYFGGITSTMSYKGIELEAFIPYTLNFDIYSSWRTTLDALGGNQYNSRKDALDSRWTPSNPSNTTPRAITGPASIHNTQASSRWLEDASYWRLRLTMAYNFQSDFLAKIGLKSAKAYCTVNNLATITDYTGYNPDGITDTGRLSPMLRTYLLGLNISF